MPPAVNPSVWRVRGDPLVGPTDDGPLRGLRVAVKDLFAVAGHPVGAGNPQWLAEATAAGSDAAAVAALRAAGAQIRGIAQTDELAYSLSGMNAHYGTPPNPAAPDRVTGGSSSGSAAAVALGEADVGLGSDTAGSIRVPAAACQLYGFRPTHAAVSVDGLISLSPSYDAVGWMARDPTTLRAVGEALLPPPSEASQPRAIIVCEPILDGVDGAHLVRDAAARAARELGLPLRIESRWPRGLPELVHAFGRSQAAQAWRSHRAWVDAHPGCLAPGIETRLRLGATVTADREAAAERLLGAWREEVLELLSAGVWFALPAAAGPPHARTATETTITAWRRTTLRCSVLGSACGVPTVVVPATAAPAPPVGLALVAAPGDDHLLLDAAVAMQTTAGRA